MSAHSLIFCRVRKNIPLKEGLRLFCCGINKYCFSVRKDIPLKEGLRLWISALYVRCMLPVRKDIPLKEGLRRNR